MLEIETESPALWIIGYGNPQRRDDGIGPYVVAKLKGILKDKEGIHLLALHQLQPELVEELRDAAVVILVDAAMNEIEGQWQWTKIGPQLSDAGHLMHHIQPAFLLGLLQSIYRRSPLTWLITVKGDDFDFGEGLTPLAEKRAHGVIAEIADVIYHQDRIFRIPNPPHQYSSMP